MILFLVLMHSGALHAQQRQNTLSLDIFLPAMSPVSYFAGEESRFIPINVKYQRSLSEHQALMVKMGLNYNWDTNGDKSVDVYPMVGIDWHPYSEGFKGFYVGPSLFFNYSRYSHAGLASAVDLQYDYWLAMGANVGYEFVSPSHIIVDIMFGLGYGYSKEMSATGAIRSGFRMDETVGGVFVGCAF